MLVKEGLLQIPFCACRAFWRAGEGPEEVSLGPCLFQEGPDTHMFIFPQWEAGEAP